MSEVLIGSLNSELIITSLLAILQFIFGKSNKFNSIELFILSSRLCHYHMFFIILSS
jgi:hypothetical protein